METNWDWDWDNQQIGSSTPRAQVDPNAELRPIAVDESLTSLLFSARPANPPTPTAAPTAPIGPEPEPAWVDVQDLLFEPA
jgi:hypothetical protein